MILFFKVSIADLKKIQNVSSVMYREYIVVLNLFYIENTSL